MLLNYTYAVCPGSERKRFKVARMRGRQWKGRNSEVTFKEEILTDVTFLSGPSPETVAVISANQIFA